VEDPERQSLCNQYTYFQEVKDYIRREITLVNTQNVSVTKIVESSSIQRAETKHGLTI